MHGLMHLANTLRFGGAGHALRKEFAGICSWFYGSMHLTNSLGFGGAGHAHHALWHHLGAPFQRDVQALHRLRGIECITFVYFYVTQSRIRWLCQMGCSQRIQLNKME